MPDAGYVGRVSLAERVQAFLSPRTVSQTGARGFDPGPALRPALPPGSDPRTFQVGVGRNISFTPRMEDRRLTPFSALRALADSHSVSRAIIQSVKRVIA